MTAAWRFGRPGAPRATLADAVVASCSIPGWYEPAVIGGRRYVDGGVRSPTSLRSLARAGVDEVFVLVPLASVVAGLAPLQPLERLERRLRALITMALLREVWALRAAGIAVTVLTPGPEDLAVMGANLMDPRRRRAVLEHVPADVGGDVRGHATGPAAGRMTGPDPPRNQRCPVPAGSPMRSSAAISSGPSRSQRTAAAQLARSCSALVAPNSTLATSGLVKGNASARAAAVVWRDSARRELAGDGDGRANRGSVSVPASPGRCTGPVLAGQRAARQAERGDDPGTCPRDGLPHGRVLDPGSLHQAVGQLDRAGRCDREVRRAAPTAWPHRSASQLTRPHARAFPAATSAPYRPPDRRPPGPLAVGWRRSG